MPKTKRTWITTLIVGAVVFLWVVGAIAKAQVASQQGLGVLAVAVGITGACVALGWYLRRDE